MIIDFVKKLNGCGKWRWAAFPSAPGPSAGSGRSENLCIFDRLQPELPASVAPRSTAAPVRPRCPQPLAFGSSNLPMCVFATQKCAYLSLYRQKINNSSNTVFNKHRVRFPIISLPPNCRVLASTAPTTLRASTTNELLQKPLKSRNP